MHKVTELKQKRAALIGDVRKIQEAATGGVLSADDLKKIDDIEKDVRNLESNIEVAERQEKREAELAAVPHNRVSGPETGGEEARAKKYTEDFRRYLITGERRDLQADVAAAGGNIVAPQQFVAQILKKLDDLVLVRSRATKYTLGSFANLGVPTISADPADADWTTEVQAVSADSTLAFGKRTMAPNMLSKLVKVSLKLLEVGTLPAESIVADRLAYKFAISEEKAFMTGNGSGQPLGLFTASSSGISTARDIATDNTTTAITFDGLTNAVFACKAQYRRNGSWLFHRDALKALRKIKTGISGDTTYVYQPSVVAGQPDTLLGYPVLESEYVPNTFTAGLYVGLFGDLSQYWIVDQIPYTVQRLNELYAATNQVGFIGRKSTDGAPVDELAFARVALAAS
jgi:HK97 family phage major capsid protein